MDTAPQRNNNEENSKLFFMVYRNIYIKKIIFHHLENFKIKEFVRFNNINEYENYKGKKCLTKIEFGDNFQIKGVDRSKFYISPSVTHIVVKNRLLKLNRVNIESTATIEFDPPTKNHYSFTKDHIPSNVKNLIFAEGFTHNPFTAGTFSINSELETFKLLSNYSRLFKIDPYVLPSKLKELTLHANFNQPLQLNSLPQSLTILRLGDIYNQPFEIGVLPQSLTLLQVSQDYDKPFELGVLPSSLTSFSTSNVLSSQIPKLNVGALPSSLTELTFKSYEYPIERGLLPNSIKRLTLPINFNQPIFSSDFNILPRDCTSLTSESYNHPIQLNQLFTNSMISHLYLLNYNHEIPVNSLPNNLISLSLDSFNHPIQINSLPNSITKLSLLNFNHQINKEVLPLNLKILNLGSLFNSEIKSLPNNLIELTFEDGPFNFKFQPNVLPTSLELLRLPADYTHHQLIDNPLPNIIEFKVGHHNFFKS